MLSVQCQQWRRTLETVQQERAKEKLENKQLLEIKVQYVCMATSLLVEIWGGGEWTMFVSCVKICIKWSHGFILDTKR